MLQRKIAEKTVTGGENITRLKIVEQNERIQDLSDSKNSIASQ